ncbi:TolC family protein [Flavobacterium sp. U410]
MKHFIYILFGLFSLTSFSQEISNEFTYEEFLAYVKKFHPLTKQADLKISEAQAKLLKARGAFDPKIESTFNQKEYGDKKYYSLFNGSFKIPTWYGIEIKAAFDNNEGIYLNSENTVPNQGLTSFGISVPVGQGLWINERMAELKKAKLYQSVNEAERKIMITEVIVEASQSYFNWKRSHSEVQLYENYLENSIIRHQGIIKSVQLGDKSKIDSVEAGILVKSRRLNLENAKLKLTKAKLELSKFLWSEDSVPLEVGDNLYPEEQLKSTILHTLNLADLNGLSSDNHPKLHALEQKIAIQTIDKRLSANSLLPKIDLSYNYLSEPSAIDNYRFEDYKFGVNFYFPLFLRKERANLKLAKIKLQDYQYTLDFERLSIGNKIEAGKQEILSLQNQMEINGSLVNDYELMLDGEERLFEMGESSLFVINSRENSLVSAKISEINLEISYLNAGISLYKTLANP